MKLGDRFTQGKYSVWKKLTNFWIPLTFRIEFPHLGLEPIVLRREAACPPGWVSGPGGSVVHTGTRYAIEARRTKRLVFFSRIRRIEEKEIMEKKSK